MFLDKTLDDLNKEIEVEDIDTEKETKKQQKNNRLELETRQNLDNLKAKIKKARTEVNTVSIIVIYKMIASFTFLFYQETWIFISIFSWVYYE